MRAEPLPFDAASHSTAGALDAHEELDKVRFKNLEEKVDGIYKVLGVGGAILISVLGWSLQQQYNGFQRQLEATSHIEQTLSKIAPNS